MSEKDIIDNAKNLIKKTINLSDEIITQEALEYIKSNKNKLVNIFLTKQDISKKAYFLAGSPGAGKSEIAQTLSKAKNIDVIDTDEIRKICPYYSGKNSDLFQKASSKGVSILLDTAFKNDYSFILDGNFAEYRLQDENINRAKKRDYKIEIYFIYRPLELAKEYTKIREEKEGRKVPENIFYQKFLDSIKTVNKIVEEYPKVELKFYDLHKDYYKNITSLNEIINKDLDFKNDIDKAQNYISLQGIKEQKKTFSPTTKKKSQDIER